MIPAVEEIRQALDDLFEPGSVVEMRAFKGRLIKFRCGRYTAYKLLGSGAIRSHKVWPDPTERRDHVLGREPLPHRVPPMISSTGDKGMRGGELRAAGSRSVNTMERREVVFDRIRLDPTLYEPLGERRPERSPEELAGRCFTIEADLEEEGIIVYGYPDYEARNKDVPMVLKISDGMSQGEFLFYLQAIGDEARNDWDSFLRMSRLLSLEDELSEDLYGGERGVTD